MISSLKPAFDKDGTITAAKASSISDGAAALVMTGRSVADRLGRAGQWMTSIYSKSTKPSPW